MRAYDFQSYYLKNSDLSDDGFCPLCKEFYDVCECKGYFIRLYNQASRKINFLKQEIKELKMTKKKIYLIKQLTEGFLIEYNNDLGEIRTKTCTSLNEVRIFLTEYFDADAAMIKKINEAIK